MLIKMLLIVTVTLSLPHHLYYVCWNETFSLLLCYLFNTGPEQISGHGSSRSSPSKDYGTTRNPTKKSKVTVIYPQNPDLYEQIKPPDCTLTAPIKRAYEQEVVEKERETDKKIHKHREQVRNLVSFMQSKGIEVAYDQQLDDDHVPCLPQWLHKKVLISDLVVLVITPSFVPLLNQETVPEKEVLFKGKYLYNLTSGQLKNKDKKPVDIVCVFLNRSKREEQIPPALVSGSKYELWEPFHSDSARADDLKHFTFLLAGKDCR